MRVMSKVQFESKILFRMAAGRKYNGFTGTKAIFVYLEISV